MSIFHLCVTNEGTCQMLKMLKSVLCVQCKNSKLFVIFYLLLIEKKNICVIFFFYTVQWNFFEGFCWVFFIPRRPGFHETGLES